MMLMMSDEETWIETVWKFSREKIPENSENEGNLLQISFE